MIIYRTCDLHNMILEIPDVNTQDWNVNKTLYVEEPQLEKYAFFTS